MNQREFYIKHIDRYLIGPGANNNIFGFDTKNELLNNYPLQAYYSGILFPEIEQANSEIDKNQTTDNSDFIEQDAEEQDKNTEKDTGQKENVNNKGETERSYSEVNSYFPSNNGLTFCVGTETKTINVVFSAGRYIDVFNKDKKQIKIKINKNEFEQLKDTSNDYSFEFAENIDYEPISNKEGWLFISKEISENVGTTKHKISNYKKKIKDLGVINPYKDPILKKFDLITGGVYFKRKELFEPVKITLLEDDKFIVIDKKI
jgi:hypothetical protein